MSVYRPKGSPFWHFDFQVKGVRFYGSTGAKDKATAKAVEAKKRVEAVERIHLRKKPEMTLNEAFGRYWDQHADDLPSARDIDLRLSRLLDGFGRDLLLSEIGDTEVSNYIAERRAEVSNSSVNRETTILRAVFLMARDEWGVEIGEMPAWKKQMLKEPAHRKRYLRADEEETLLAALRPDMVPLVRFCLITGARVGSARRLSWVDIDYQANVITFRDVKSKLKGESHAIPLTDELKVLLANERGNHPLYVLTYERRRSNGALKRGERYPYTRDGWRKAWRAAVLDAGLDDFRFHDLRHTAATRILRATGNLAVVQRILGHADIKTTMRYAHVEMDDMRLAMEAVSRNIPEPADEPDHETGENPSNINKVAANDGAA